MLALREHVVDGALSMCGTPRYIMFQSTAIPCSCVVWCVPCTQSFALFELALTREVSLLYMLGVPVGIVVLLAGMNAYPDKKSLSFFQTIGKGFRSQTNQEERLEKKGCMYRHIASIRTASKRKGVHFKI